MVITLFSSQVVSNWKMKNMFFVQMHFFRIWGGQLGLSSTVKYLENMNHFEC